MVTVAEAITTLQSDMEDSADGFPMLRWHADGAKEAQFFDKVATEIARGYHQGRYSYEFGDFAANALWSTYIHSVGKDSSEIQSPGLLIEVSEAFDAGELPSPSVSDPIKTYTDHMIAEFVRKL